MKKITALLLSAALLLGTLGACREAGPDTPVSTDWTASALVNLAYEYSGRGDRDGLEAFDAETDREWMSAYLENAYRLEIPWKDAAVIRATGASAFELAVLQLEDGDGAVRAASSLMSYIFSRQGDFAGYAPAEADMVAKGSIQQDGPFAALFICPNPDSAGAAFLAALEDAALPSAAVDATGDAKGLRDVLVSWSGMDGAALELLDGGDPDALNAYLKDAYGVDPGLPEDCAVARGTGASAFEIAVLRFSDWDASRDVEKRLNSYLDAREGQLSGSDQSDMLYQALVISSEPYLVLLACENAEEGGMAFTKAAGTSGYGYSMRHQFPSSDSDYPDRCKFTPPNQDDMSLYDTAAIRAAWEAGDPSPLSRYDRDIYNAAQKVLGKILRGGMGDLEKETAIYGWLVNNVDYDWTHQNIMATTPRESFTPYGGLVNHTAVCLGYATSFQLLCDLAGVECITVAGAAFSSREDHGWNMVRLDGAWYCVDATWDANSREMGFAQSKEKDWDYFNVTSDYMALSNHQWDYANTPEAVTEGNGRG